jgi:hypothetical protein
MWDDLQYRITVPAIVITGTDDVTTTKEIDDDAPPLFTTCSSKRIRRRTIVFRSLKQIPHLPSERNLTDFYSMAKAPNPALLRKSSIAFDEDKITALLEKKNQAIRRYNTKKGLDIVKVPNAYQPYSISEAEWPENADSSCTLWNVASKRKALSVSSACRRSGSISMLDIPESVPARDEPPTTQPQPKTKRHWRRATICIPVTMETQEDSHAQTETRPKTAAGPLAEGIRYSSGSRAITQTEPVKAIASKCSPVVEEMKQDAITQLRFPQLGCAEKATGDVSDARSESVVRPRSSLTVSREKRLHEDQSNCPPIAEETNH